MIDDKRRCEFRSGTTSRRCKNEGRPRGIPAWNYNEEPHVSVFCDRHTFIADVMRQGAADRWQRQLEGKLPLAPDLDRPRGRPRRRRA
jgi:hypothetical protein